MEALSLRRSAASRVLPAWGAGLIGALALFAMVPDLLTTPFINDDYIFLDQAANRGVLDLWGFESLAFDWWRPWSRELHYWTLSRLFGPNEVLFHLFNLVLAGAVLALYFSLARRLIGDARAALATAGVAAMAAWALPLLWVAGCQDLWMLLWALLALHAWTRGRTLWATLAYALALMSKETAAPLPLVFLAWDIACERRTWPQALRRLAPVAAVTLMWAAAHPQLGGRWWRSAEPVSAPLEARLAWPTRLVRSLAMLLNLDRVPAPYRGLEAVFLAMPGAVLLAALVLMGAKAATRIRERGVDAVSAVWTTAGLLPLMLPTIGWHAYYGLHGALGAWLWLASRTPFGPRIWAPAVAVLALLGAARADTESTDWGDAYYQRRAARMVRETRDLIRSTVPSVSPHTRLWFTGLPDRIGLLQGDGPAIRLLYRDPTLRAGYWGQWLPAPADAPGRDRFFRLHEGPRLVEVHADGSDSTSERLASAEWADDLQALALQLHLSGDSPRASRLLERVARARVRDAEPAYNLAIVRMALGDSLGAGEWLLEATRRPERNARLRLAARNSGLGVFEGPAPETPRPR